MPLTTQIYEYSDASQSYDAYMALPEAPNGGTIIVCHAWAGQTDFERNVAESLAEKGYIGIAIDVYGQGKRGTTTEENSALMQPLLSDRSLLQSRLALALEAAAHQNQVDAGNMAAIGFCFGGLSVLDMARMGAPVKGVVSFHGLFTRAENLVQTPVSAKILALHGWDDPMATPDNVLSFAKEMTEAEADWQLHAYGHTLHAFTHPEAQDKSSGTFYDASATRRAWAACDDFLKEVLNR